MAAVSPAVAEGEVAAVTPGRATVTCAAPGGSVDANVRVLPSEWSAFAWTRSISVEVAGRVVVPFSDNEAPPGSWTLMTEAFLWRTDSGRPAYVVLVEQLDLSVTRSCRQGKALVLTAGDGGPRIRNRIDLGERCDFAPVCNGCGPSSSDTLAPPRFTATGLVAGGVRYGWRDEALVQNP